MSERDLAAALAQYLDVSSVGADDFPAAPVETGLFNASLLRHHRLVPLDVAHDLANGPANTSTDDQAAGPAGDPAAA